MPQPKRSPSKPAGSKPATKDDDSKTKLEEAIPATGDPSTRNAREQAYGSDGQSRGRTHLPSILGGGWLTPCDPDPRDDEFFPDLDGDEAFGIQPDYIRLSADAAYVHAFAPTFSAMDELLEHVHELCIDDEDETILCELYAYRKQRPLRFPAQDRDAMLEPYFGAGDNDERHFEDHMSAVTESLIALEQARCCDGEGQAHPAELLDVQLAARSLASYASGVGASLDPYLVDEAVVELREAFQILESVARETCIGGRRNVGAFNVIAKYSGIEGGDVAVARRVQSGVNARKALRHLAGENPLDPDGLEKFTPYVYGWAAANAKLREDGPQVASARALRARAGQDAAKQKIYLLPQRLSW